MQIFFVNIKVQCEFDLRTQIKPKLLQLFVNELFSLAESVELADVENF